MNLAPLIVTTLLEAEDYQFETCCINADGQDIRDMVDQARSITYGQFFRHVPLSAVFVSGVAYMYYWTPSQCRLAGVDYEEVRKNWPLTQKNDVHISYHQSVYRGKPCYYFKHSAIEYIFTEP